MTCHFVQGIALHLQMHGAGDRREGLAHAAGADRVSFKPGMEL